MLSPLLKAGPDPVETYLRRATLGLPAHVAGQVRDELEEHLLCRAAQLEHQGLSPTQALARAVRELGPPGHVTAGMNKVHNMPRLAVGAVLTVLTASALLYAAAGGAQHGRLILPVVTERPITPSCVKGTPPSPRTTTIVSQKGGVTCYTFKDRTVYQGAYLGLTALKQAVAAQGGSIKELPDGQIRAAFPGGTWMTLAPFFTAAGERYFPAHSVASSLIGMFRADHVTLSGYAQPVIQGGPVRLQFGSAQQNIGEAFYQGFGLDLVSWLLSNRQTEGTGMTLSWTTGAPGLPQATHRIPTDQRPGEVVMLVMRHAGNRYFTAFAPVGANGTVTIPSVPERLRFVSSMSDLSPYPSGGRFNALLVRVTNVPMSALRTGIFVPAQPTSDAR